MLPYAPATELETHEVTNQPPPLVDINLYETDLALREGVRREAGDWLDQRALALGAVVGSEAVLALGAEVNRHPPELDAFDRYGRRLDEVRFHPGYHQLMALAMEHRIHDLAWTEQGLDAHLAHAVLLALFTQAEAGTMCPINMTYAAVPALRSAPEVGAPWLGKLIGGRYDAALKPLADKAGVTLGMAMTEKQGGSDVRANTTRAEALGEGLYRLIGHKWFCSAPMSDGFLTLAYAAGGLTCFLLPRIAPDGGRNPLHLMRLKDKLGDRSNASAEIEYHGAIAWRIGEAGQGVKTIIEMVHHTRLGTISSTLGVMRRALMEAAHHVAGRTAFQKRLIDQPAMRAVIADLALEYEAAAALVTRVARAFGDRDEGGRAFARLAVALAKFRLTKRCPDFVYECMECHGGVGYVEETPLPRYYRQAPLNGIWEGSGNVIALDVLRTLAREPLALQAYAEALAETKGAHPALDRAADDLIHDLAGAAPAEADARRTVERMALVLQASLLARHAPGALADGFIRSRLLNEGGRCYGALPSGVDPAPMLARQTI